MALEDIIKIAANVVKTAVVAGVDKLNEELTKDDNKQ